MGEHLAYHLEELRIALDPSDARRVLPELRETDRTILDVGCGIGQTLVALGAEDRRRIGVDVDEAAIRHGLEVHGGRIELAVAAAERLPLPDATADLVICRVALPYTNVPRALAEMRRVLRPGGRLWLTLHERRTVQGYLRDALRARHPVRIAHVLYILANGALLSSTGRVLPWLDGRFESWQSPQAVDRLLRRHGLEVATRRQGRHAVVEACLPIG
jgi:ubiquinone/menaquinone biosynthesis C-methylase UbiE